MGVLEPVIEEFEEEPTTPPGVHDEEGSDDDLFAEVKLPEGRPPVFTYNDLTFKDILPVLPAKGDFDLDLLGMRTILEIKPKKECKGGCFEDVKKDLRKLACMVEEFKRERDEARAENERLKKELEEAKKRLKEKEELEKGDVKIYLKNASEEKTELLVRKRNFENTRNVFNSKDLEKSLPEATRSIKIQSVSVSLPENYTSKSEPKVKKSIAQLRKEFFEDFQSEQKTFTSRNYLEIKPDEKSVTSNQLETKPEEKKKTFRSKLNIRIKPRQRISEMISKLTSKFGGSVVIPEAPQISMFQSFEKTRIVWQNEVEKCLA